MRAPEERKDRVRKARNATMMLSNIAKTVNNCNLKNYLKTMNQIPSSPIMRPKATANIMQENGFKHFVYTVSAERSYLQYPIRSRRRGRY